jgi:glucokinase
VILAGDIGATKTDLALFRDQTTMVARQQFQSGRHAGIDEVLREFLSREHEAIDLACLGVAGPVSGGTVTATNLPWTVDGRALGRSLGLDRVRLLNDLEATAWGIAALGQTDMVELQAGSPAAAGNAAVIAAGTGLGEAGLLWDGHRQRPWATEAGHSDFAPQDETQTELFRYLSAQFGHVSVERVLSGPGLVNLYRFLRDTGRSREPAWLAEELQGGDPPAVIAAAGLGHRSDLCSAALDLFASLYGSEAGNMALRLLATGGVYVAGGVGPKLLPRLTDGRFISAFLDKGRMRGLLEQIPVRLVVSDRVNQLGAARCAVELAGNDS